MKPVPALSFCMQSNSFAEPKHKNEYPLRCPLAGEPLESGGLTMAVRRQHH
jgi:hypothetical protein